MGGTPDLQLEATLRVGSTTRRDLDPRRWRYQIQRYYQQARSQVGEQIGEAIADPAGPTQRGGPTT